MEKSKFNKISEELKKRNLKGSFLSSEQIQEGLKKINDYLRKHEMMERSNRIKHRVFKTKL